MIELLNHIARLWWDWTASMFWQIGLLILLIGCLDLIIRKRAWPQLRYALWSLILVKLILPPSLSLPSGIVPELRPAVGQAVRWLNSEKPDAGESPAAICLYEDMFTAPTRESALAIDSSVSGGIVKIEDLGAGLRGEGVPPLRPEEKSKAKMASPQVNHRQASLDDATQQVTPDSDPGPQLEWRVYALMIWFLGTLILGIWLFLRLHSVAGRQVYQAAAASLPQSFYNHLADCAMRLGLRRIPRVAVTKRLTNPAVFGVFRPVLLMPKGYLSRLSRRDTEHMLLHELAHVKRGDLVMHGLYMLLQIVYWYNPLLWLVRQQMHHLRELSCDATVAELLRERTPAYRQTLLETARRLLATSAEPGLGLLGLFEDSNRLLVRLNWLTKPTWRYRTMKRVIVATIAALMFVCVLPMAQARESASNERTPTVVREQDQQSQDQLPEDIASLQARLEQLKAQERQLQEQLRSLSARRNQTSGRQESGQRREATRRQSGAQRSQGDLRAAPPESPAAPGGGRPQRERMPGGLEVAPPKSPAGPGRGERVPPEARQQVPRAQAQQWATQMQAWAEQLHQWEQSEEMRKWQDDMAKWGEQIGRWSRELARRQPGAGDESADGPEMPEMTPMPAMPAMPAMPHAPAAAKMDVTVEPVPQPMPMPRRAGGGGAPRAARSEIRMPRVEIPHIEMPKIDPPAPPEIPEKAEGQEEVVSRTEHTIDLAPGRSLDVKNEMGSITVRGSNEPGCKLVVTVKGRADTMEEARKIVKQTETIIKPSQDGVSVTTTKPENENNREHVNRVVMMEFVVPHEAQIRVSQAFGSIRLTNLDGSVKAVSNMGSILATSVRGQVALESNFGAIDLRVPENFSAKVQAKADFGSIQSDLPLEFVKSDGPSLGSKASGIIGRGESNVSLKSNMGSIRIRSQTTESGRERF